MRSLIVAVPFLLLAGCVAPGAPKPPVAPAPAPPPVPMPVAPASSDWRDWPLTPGEWRYQLIDANSSNANYGSVLSVACSKYQRSIMLIVRDTATKDSTDLTIRTSSQVRRLTGSLTGTGHPVAVFPANDPLLDAMGYSRGRFVIEQPGRPPLVIPAWPEILRVAEDCRR